jgi:hypothetical protein
MPLRGSAVTAYIGAKGFDTNNPIPETAARDFHQHGYRFAVRYVRREKKATNDLSRDEIRGLFNAGLAVMPVQHAESESSWVPTVDKGRLWGQNAVMASMECGIATGTTVWLDLEGVAVGTPHEDIIQFCNYWYDRVYRSGFQPGVYVGWHSGLTASELYKRLKFTRYWGAFNLDVDKRPLVRGLCMKQGTAKAKDLVPSFKYQIDTDVIVADAFDGVPTVFAPEEWT